MTTHCKYYKQFLKSMLGNNVYKNFEQVEKWWKDLENKNKNREKCRYSNFFEKFYFRLKNVRNVEKLI